MSTGSAAAFVVYVSAGVVSWLGTYAIHSTLLIGGVWLFTRSRSLDAGIRERAWLFALYSGVATASLVLVAGVHPLAGRFEVAGFIESMLWQDTPRSLPVQVDYPETGFGSKLTDPAALLRLVPLVVVFAWMAYALLVVGRVLVLTARARDSLGSRVSAPVELRDHVQSLGERLGVRRPIALTVSGAFSTPVALGSTEIAIPTRLVSELSQDEQQSVLAHEVAHIARRDPWWLLLAATAEALFFFQVLNRLARVRWQQEAEYLCDGVAARVAGTPLPLARSLLKVAEWGRAETPPLLVPALTEQASSLRSRVQVLVEGTHQASAHVRVVSMVTLGMLFVLVAGAAPALAPGSVRGWGAPAFNWAEVLPAGHTLEVQGVLGSILAIPSESDTAHVRATRRGKNAGGDVTFAVVHSPGRVTVCALYPVPRGIEPNRCVPGGGPRHGTRENDAEMEFLVYVPGGVSLAVSTIVGDIRARHLDAPVNATTSTGKVDVATTSYAAAATRSGNIRIAMGSALWDGALSIESLSGNISVTLPQTSDVAVAATTRTGRITSSIPMQTGQATGLARARPRGSLGGSGAATLGRGGRELVVQSISGNVSIRLTH